MLPDRSPSSQTSSCVRRISSWGDNGSKAALAGAGVEHIIKQYSDFQDLSQPTIRDSPLDALLPTRFTPSWLARCGPLVIATAYRFLLRSAAPQAWLQLLRAKSIRADRSPRSDVLADEGGAMYRTGPQARVCRSQPLSQTQVK